MAGRLHLKVQGSNKRNPYIDPRRIDYMKNQGLASSLHGQFPIKIRQNNLLTTYKSSCSTIAQPSLTTLVHVPPYLMDCYHFRRENFISSSFLSFFHSFPSVFGGSSSLHTKAWSFSRFLLLPLLQFGLFLLLEYVNASSGPDSVLGSFP